MAARPSRSGLGLVRIGKKILLYFLPKRDPASIQAATGSPEGEFDAAAPVLFRSKAASSKTNPYFHDFRIAKISTGFFLTYKLADGPRSSLHGAYSKDLLAWDEIGPLAGIRETGAVVSLLSHRDRLVLYFGEKNIHLAVSADLHRWRVKPRPVLLPRPGSFDSRSLALANVFMEKEGILVIYYGRNAKGRYAIGTALFDRKDPEELLWRSEKPLWEAPPEWTGRKIAPLGVVEYGGNLITYWESAEEGIFSVTLTRTGYFGKRRRPEFAAGGPALLRFQGNPILRPRPHNRWESKASFNPTAFVEEGKVHIIYRAIGDDDVSYLGYAVSSDGVHIDERLDEPIYVPTQPFEGAVPGREARHGSFHGSPFASGGGGWGGCEDPRVTRMGDRLYMTYVAYDGWSEPRVALTSIAMADFLARRWHWKKPVLISRPGEVNKNACILPEKVNGKYVVFHRVYPDILIDYVDDLDFDGETRWLEGQHRIRPKRDAWDSRKLGVGGAPILTEHGWLLVYQGVGEQDPGRYKIGAMLLDRDDPTWVLHRAKDPILEPEEVYENSGHKWGVVYPCGAVVKDGELLIYYGGADRFTAVASAPLDRFLQDLMSSESPRITRLPVPSY